MSRYLDVVKRVAASYAHAKTAKTAKSDPITPPQFSQFSQFSHSRQLMMALDALKSRCPEHIDLADWKIAISDGSLFISVWSEKAAALDWNSRDLVGLAPVPAKPAPNFRRLARYDLTGLVWLLRGRPVIALTSTSAVIQHPSGAVTIFRKQHKPPLEPMAMDDFN